MRPFLCRDGKFRIMGVHVTHVTDQFTKSDKTSLGLSLPKASADAELAVRQAHRER